MFTKVAKLIGLAMKKDSDLCAPVTSKKDHILLELFCCRFTPKLLDTTYGNSQFRAFNNKHRLQQASPVSTRISDNLQDGSHPTSVSTSSNPFQELSNQLGYSNISKSNAFTETTQVC